MPFNHEPVLGLVAAQCAPCLFDLVLVMDLQHAVFNFEHSHMTVVTEICKIHKQLSTVVLIDFGR